MKKIIFAILFLSLHVASFAIKTEDMYIMRHTTKGQLFFISENILNFLVENYGIAPITTPEEDLKSLLNVE